MLDWYNEVALLIVRHWLSLDLYLARRNMKKKTKHYMNPAFDVLRDVEKRAT